MSSIATRGSVLRSCCGGPPATLPRLAARLPLVPRRCQDRCVPGSNARSERRRYGTAALLLFLAALVASCGDAGPQSSDTIVQTQIAANGFVFDARTAGAPGHPPVLLLHGFPESSLEWEAQLGALARAGYFAVAPDLRGYSPGARPDGVASYRMPELVADVLAIADRLGFASFHLVGHDWGAAIAWNVAMAVPERIRSLTAVSVPHPIAFALALANDPDQQSKSRYITFFQQVGVAEQTLLANDAAVLRSIYGSAVPAAHVDTYVALLSEPGALTDALDYYRALGLTDSGGSKVVVPTLYVWSTGDTALGRYGAEHTGDYVTGPYRFAVLDGVSHWVPEEAATELNALLLDHLATYP
jgi:pimeloyl-ACP methyl ester carboxylesterase